jgi:cytochrome c peroxidase
MPRHTILLFPVGLLLLTVLLGSRQFTVPTTEEALGEMLFSDPILSSNRTQSCATCHIPAFAFADTTAVSIGAEGTPGTRNTPGITNMGGRPYFFWDGRAATLKEQVLQPISNPVEMNLSLEEAVRRLRNDARYAAAFQSVYQKAPDADQLAAALTAFIGTLEMGGSDFDRWMRGDENAMSASAVRGRTIFMEKGKCFDCHFGPDFTGDEFRNIGLYDGQALNDSGRFALTMDSTDLGKFKTPGLRNVALTAPYMHNGMFKTLREVIDYYDNPGHFLPDSQNRDTLLARPLQLTEQEKTDLEAFMLALTSKRFKQ